MNIGGPAVQVTGLMQELDPKIFNQILITGYVANSEADYLIENKIDIPVIRIEGLGRTIDFMADIKAFLALTKLIREIKPEIIHTHTAKAGVLGRTAWIFAGYKPILVHTFHGHLLHGYFSKFKTKLVVLIEKTLGLITNQFFAVGNKVAEDLIEAGIGTRNKFTVMAPGLSVKKLPDRTEICGRYNLDPTKFYCTFLGRVTDIKKPFRVLEIAKLMKEIDSHINFLIIGAGELLDECKEIILQQSLPVKTLGWISKVEDALAISDLMLLTSANEGMPLSLIQAGMVGIPSVSTNAGSVSEVVIDQKAGFVLDYDAYNFANLIHEIFQDSKLRSELGKFAREYTNANFSVDRLAKDHQEAYLKLVN
jgi:glycosyltransferase involved in cell wall biosynthesis